MNIYFKVKAYYDKKISEEEIKKVSELYLFEVPDYKTAQIVSTKYLEKQIYGEFDVDITKYKTDIIIKKDKSSENSDDNYWYEGVVTTEMISDNGSEKYLSTKYLAEANSLEDSIEAINNYNEKVDSSDETYLSSVKETDFEKVLRYDELKEFLE